MKACGSLRRGFPALLLWTLFAAELKAQMPPVQPSAAAEVDPSVNISGILSFHGSTRPASAERAIDRDATNTEIFSRNTGFGLEFDERSENALGFTHALNTELRIDLTRYERSNPAFPEDRASRSSGPRAMLLPSGSTFAGVHFARYASLLFGYVPDRHAADPATGEAMPSVDMLLRRSVYPGLHIQLELPGFGSLRLTPLSLMDTPGRDIPRDAPFRGSTLDALALQSREGTRSSDVGPDRLAYGGEVHVDLEGWRFGADLRSASLHETGPSSRSWLVFQQSRMHAGYAGRTFHMLASIGRAWGSLSRNEGYRTSIDGFSATFSGGMHYRFLFFDLFAMQTQPARRHRGDGSDPADRLGWIDTEGSPADLPVLGGTYGILLHPVPCAPTTTDRCDGIVESANPAGFRRAGKYGDFTLGLQGEHWQAAFRAGLLVPTPELLPFSPGTAPIPYQDFAEAALDLSLHYPEGSFHIAWGGEHRRSKESGHRVLDAQALSIYCQIRFQFRASEPSRPLPERTVGEHQR